MGRWVGWWLVAVGGWLGRLAVGAPVSYFLSVKWCNAATCAKKSANYFRIKLMLLGYNFF